MNTVQDFLKIRRDGNIILENMSIQEILALGKPSPVGEIKWVCSGNGKSVSFNFLFGVSAHVVQGRQFVVAVASTSNSRGFLTIFNCDGTVHLNISTTQIINGNYEPGDFCWLVNAHYPANNVFGVVFQCSSHLSAKYLMDIDAVSGSVLECTWTK